MIKKAKGKYLDAIGHNLGFERKQGFLFKESDRKFKARMLSSIKTIPYNGKSLWQDIVDRSEQND